MNLKEEKIEVSDKHVGLRLALFLIAMGLAVYFFTNAVTNMGIHEEGYYVITPGTDKETPNYSSGVEFTYHITGEKPAEMRELNKLVTQEYSAVLARAYKLLSSSEVFEEYRNIAYIDGHRGEKIVLSDELYSVLKDAYDKTEDQKGFNMFAGALYSEWESIVYAYNREECDPLFNDEEASRIEKIASQTKDLSNFGLVFDDAEKSVVFTVSDRYEELLEELGIEAPVLDLNLMKYAYELETVRAHMEAKGLTAGILTSDNGLLSGGQSLVLNMEDVPMSYPIYEWTGEEVRETRHFDMEGKFSLAVFRAFPLSENDLSAYVLKDSEGKAHFRNMYFDVDTGLHTEMINCDYCFALSRHITDAAYANLRINSAWTAEEFREMQKADNIIKRLISSEFE